MGLFDELGNILKPHADKLNDTLAFHSNLLHYKLAHIEQAVSDLGNPDIGDKWQRFQIKKKFASGEKVEIGTCPVNEIWLIQCIASDGVQEKSPAYVIEANGLLIESIIKEGLGFEGISGSQAILPGEEFTLTARAEGSINCVITIIRRQYPVPKIQTQYGRDTEVVSHRNVHEIARDLIASRTDIYTEPPREVDPSRGRQNIPQHQVEILTRPEQRSGHNKAVD